LILVNARPAGLSKLIPAIRIRPKMP